MEENEQHIPDYTFVEDYIYTFKNKPLILHIKLKLSKFVKLLDLLHDKGYTKTKTLTENEYLDLVIVNKDNTFLVDNDKFEYIMKKI